MEENETIERTLEVMKNLPEEAQKEVNKFAELIMARYENKILVKGMMELQNRSLRVFDFLDDGEVYTEKDVKFYYED